MRTAIAKYVAILILIKTAMVPHYDSCINVLTKDLASASVGIASCIFTLQFTVVKNSYLYIHFDM